MKTHLSTLLFLIIGITVMFGAVHPWGRRYVRQVWQAWMQETELPSIDERLVLQLKVGMTVKEIEGIIGSPPGFPSAPVGMYLAKRGWWYLFFEDDDGKLQLVDVAFFKFDDQKLERGTYVIPVEQYGRRYSIDASWPRRAK